MGENDFLDPSLFTGPHGALDVFNANIRKTFDYDSFAGPVFFAKVLNHPLALSADQMAAILATGAKGVRNKKRLTKFIFKGRIEELHGEFLDPPCDLEFAPTIEAKEEARRIISEHTDFIGATAHIKSMPAKNDIVKVRLKRGSYGSWDLQFGDYIEMVEEGGVEVALPAGCLETKEVFDEAEFDDIFFEPSVATLYVEPEDDDLRPYPEEAVPPPTTSPMSDGGGIAIGMPPESVIEWARLYDLGAQTWRSYDSAALKVLRRATNSTPALTRDPRIQGCLGRLPCGSTPQTPENALPLIESLHPVMQQYLKAIAYRAWNELGLKLHLNSAYRTFSEQQGMRKKYDDCKAKQEKEGVTSIKAINAKCTTGGVPAEDISYHNFGLAFDANLIENFGTGKWYNKSGAGGGDNTSEGWIATGYVKLIEEGFQLAWGGRWVDRKDKKDNYDPVHVGMDDSVGKKLLGVTTAKLMKLIEEQDLAQAPNTLVIPLKTA